MQTLAAARAMTGQSTTLGGFELIRWRPFLLFFFVALVSQGLYFFRSELPDEVVTTLAIETVIAGPLLLLAARCGSGKWSALYVTQIGIAFAGVMFFIHDWDVWNEDIRTTAHVVSDGLAVTAVGVGASGLGIVLCAMKFPKMQGTLLASAPLWGSWQFWLFSYIATIGVNPFLNSGLFGYLGSMLSRWPIIAILALDVLGRSGKAPPQMLRWVWLFLIPLRLLMSFGTAFGMFVIHDLIILLFYLSIRRIIKLRVYGLLLFAALTIVVFAGRTYIRNVIWQQYEAAPNSRLHVGWATLQGLWNYSFDDYVSNTDAMLNDRIGHYTFIPQAVVVRDTPERIPYLEGESLYQLFWVFVPRFAYPDKPTEDWGQKFGHRYALLHPSDYLTSFNFPRLTEAYASGGMLSVLALMFILAALVQLVGLWSERLSLYSPDVLWVLLPLVFGSVSDCFSNLTLGLDEAIYTTIILALPAYFAVRIRTGGRPVYERYGPVLKQKGVSVT